MGLIDLFRKKKEQVSAYNPLNIQDDPNLRKFHQIPDITSVIKKELSTFYMQSLTSLHDVSIYTITENYAISLLKSYYANAKIVPMCIVDEVIKQVYNASYAALGQPVCESANLFKLRVLNKINGTNTKQKDIESPIITFAKQALTNSQSNNQKAEIEALVQLYNEVQKASSKLLITTDYNLVGSAFCLMGSYPAFMNNEDSRRVIADNAFYCLSKAIEQNPSKEIYLKRLAILAIFHKDFYYTIANAMNIPDDDDDDIFQISAMPLIIKTNQYYYDIAYHDFQKVKLTSYPEQIGRLYELVNQQINDCDAQKGKEYIDKIVEYLTSVYQQY